MVSVAPWSPRLAYALHSGATSLLRIDEVRIFHEFGHALHGLWRMALVAFPARECWDFVELPSQIMENLIYEKEALALFSSHFETGEPLPDELLEKMIAAKNFQAGVANVTQVRYANLDLSWHTADPDSVQDVGVFEDEAIEPSSYHVWKD